MNFPYAQKPIILYNDNFPDKSLKKYNLCIKKVLDQRIHKEKKKEFLYIIEDKKYYNKKLGK